MGHVLAFTMQKGGVGKTTTALNLGVILAGRSARVLLIDLDPQANLTRGLGVDPATVEYSIYEVLLNTEQGTAFATLPTASGARLIPATKNLAGAVDVLGPKIGREFFLKKALKETRNQYDYILIDSPPNLGLLTANALVAADAAIVPVQTHAYAFQALPELEETIELVREANPRLELGGIVCTFADRRTRLTQTVEQQLRAAYGELVFDTVIPLNTKLAEAPAYGEPITVYAPDSSGALAYAALSEELEKRYAYKET